MAQSWVSKFELRHKGSGKWCYVPSEEGRATGLAVLREVKAVWNAPDYYFHLRKGGHVAAIQHHLSNASFLRLDLKNFFGCITPTRITRSLRSKLGYLRAREIALLSTVSLPGAPGSCSLPYGFVQSPLLGRVNTNSDRVVCARQSRAWRSHPHNSPPLSTACPSSVATSA